MTTEPRFRLARLTECHGALQRDHAEALKRADDAEKNAVAHETRARELEAALKAVEENAKALERAAAELRAAQEGTSEKDRAAADALEKRLAARGTEPGRGDAAATTWIVRGNRGFVSL